MSIVQIGFVQALPLGACPSSERNVLHALAWYADHTGENIYPGHETLAGRAGVDRRWLRILLRRLEQRGWLKVITRGRGRGIRSTYELRLPSFLESQPTLPIGPDSSCGKAVEKSPAAKPRKGDRSCRKGDRSITSSVDRSVDGATRSLAEIVPIRPLIRPQYKERTTGAARQHPFRPVEKCPKEASFAQLCAVAKRELEAEPLVESSDWKERIKARLQADGYARPVSDQVRAAMDAVEHLASVKQRLAAQSPGPARRRRARG